MAKIDIFAPQDTSMVKGLEGQKILLYGGNDTGKTYQSTRLLKPMLIMAEAGGNARAVKKFPINEWNDFTQIVDQLVKTYDKAKESFQTLIPMRHLWQLTKMGLLNNMEFRKLEWCKMLPRVIQMGTPLHALDLKIK